MKTKPRRLRKGDYVEDSAGTRSTVVKVLKNGRVITKFGIGGIVNYDPVASAKLKPVERT